MFNLTSLNIKSQRNQNEKQKKINSYFMVKSEDDFKKTKKNFIHYLIDDQPQYADLTRIETELKEQNNILLTKLNKNKAEINQKKKQLKQINEIIQKTLMSNIKFNTNINKQTKEDTKEIKTMKDKIDSLSFSLQVYEGIIIDLKKEKENLIKKRTEETRNLADAEKQLDKFKMIQSSVKTEEKQKKILLRQLNVFQFRSEQFLNDEMNKKKQTFTNLEYKLNRIKQDIEYFNSKLNMLKKKQKKFKTLIEDQNNKNEKICYDTHMLIQDFIFTKTRINMIYNQMKVKQIEPIIFKFKKDNLEYNTLSLIYKSYLKELTDLRSQLSYHQKELRNIKHQQLLKKMNLQNKNDNNNYIASEILEEKFKELEVQKQKNETKELEYFKQEIILKSNLNIMIEFDEDITRIQINQLINLIFSISLDNLNNHSYTILSERIKRNFDNQEIPYHQLKYFLNHKKDYSLKDFKVFLTIFIKFQRKIINIYYNFYSSLGKEKKGKRSNELIHSISTMFSKNQLENIIKNRLNLYNEKVQIKKIANDEIFKIQQKKKEERLFGNSGKMSISSLLSSFISTKDYENKEIYNRFKTKFPHYLKKYTNEFVSEKDTENIFKNKKEDDDSTIEKTARKNYLKENTLVKFQSNNKNKKNERILTDNNSDSDFEGYNSYIENFDKLNNVKPSTNFFSKQKDNKYKRMNELYLLEMKLYNKLEDKIYEEINQNFHKRKNERFYRGIYNAKYGLKRKNTRKITIKLVDKNQSNNNQNTNINNNDVNNNNNEINTNDNNDNYISYKTQKSNNVNEEVNNDFEISNYERNNTVSNNQNSVEPTVKRSNLRKKFSLLSQDSDW